MLIPCSLVGVGETFLQAKMGGALLLPWEEWEKNSYNSSNVAMLLPGSIATPMGACCNAPPMFACRNIPTTPPMGGMHPYMGGVGQIFFLQANMGGMHCYIGSLWEKHSYKRTMGGMLLPCSLWEEWEKHSYHVANMGGALFAWEEWYMGGVG